MFTTTALALLAPLFLAPPQGPFSQDYIIGQEREFSADVITLRETANAPAGFATLEMATMDADGADTDLIIIRTDTHHNILWKQRIGGHSAEYPGNLLQTHDGGILVSCFSLSTPIVDQRAVLVKLDDTGAYQWAHSYRGDEFTNQETRAHVTQITNGNLVLITALDGQHPTSIAGGQHLLDSHGLPITMWRQFENWNLPIRILYRGICEVDGKVAACGEIIRELPDGAGGPTRNSFVTLLSDTCGCTNWFFEYPISPTQRDWANAIQFTVNGDLIVAGAIGGLFGAHTGYLMRLKVDGSLVWTNTYPSLPLTDVVEDVNPMTDPTTGPLTVIGTHLLEPDQDGFAPLHASMMLTTPDGAPLHNLYYNPSPLGIGVALVHHYESTDGAPDGVFGLATALMDVTGAGPIRQHWLRADPDLKTGCHEEAYDQPFHVQDVGILPVPLVDSTIDGDMLLNWDPIDPNIEVVDICAEDPPHFPALCFGDGTGTPCPCGNTDGPTAGCANSTGLGAILSGAGTASVSVDTLVLSISQAKPSQPVLFFQGINFINSGNGNPFGDGLRCCGGGVRRLQIRFMDASGSASTTAALSVEGAVAAGTTYCNQAWYRDPPGAGGSPCSTFFNLSNAISVTWAP